MWLKKLMIRVSRAPKQATENKHNGRLGWARTKQKSPNGNALPRRFFDGRWNAQDCAFATVGPSFGEREIDVGKFLDLLWGCTSQLAGYEPTVCSVGVASCYEGLAVVGPVLRLPSGTTCFQPSGAWESG